MAQLLEVVGDHHRRPVSTRLVPFQRLRDRGPGRIGFSTLPPPQSLEGLSWRLRR